MPLPKFLAPVGASRTESAISAPLGGRSPASVKLALSIARQEQTNWCWSAVAGGVANFYAGASVWSQCGLANATLGRADCCGTGAGDPGACNKPWYLDDALTVARVFRSIQSSPLTFADVQRQIAQSAPVGTRVQWAGGGGHFQTIVGWIVGSDGGDYLNVSDPIFLNQVIPYSEFETSYQGSGAWTHSYLTGPPAMIATAGGAIERTASRDPETIGA